MSHRKTEGLLSLYRLGRRIKFAAKNRSTDSMLTASILLALEEGPVKLTDLGEHLAMKPAAMSEQMSKLEKQGLVQKATGKDKRAKMLTLTTVGRKGAEKIREAMEDHCLVMFANLTASEVESLHGLLGKLVV